MDPMDPMDPTDKEFWGKMTMAVNMAYVRKPESGTKVLKMTPP
jgi:hypothetical protein